MKKKLLFIVLIYLSVTVAAQQNPKIRFQGVTPKWQHISIDSSSISDIDSIESNGMDKFELPRLMLYDSNIFVVSRYHGYYGTFIEYLNKSMGKLNWNSFVDYRNTDKEEVYSYFYINEDDEFEVMSFREKYDYRSIYKTFSKRSYDFKTGELLDFKYGNENDTLCTTMIWASLRQRSHIYPLKNSNYQYISTDRFNDLKADSIDLFSHIVNDIGQVIETHNFSFDKIYPNIFVMKLQLLNKDSIFVFHTNFNTYDVESDTFVAKYFIDIFDRDLNLLSTNELGKNTTEGNEIGLFFPYFGKQYFMIKKRYNKHTYFYIIDYEGKVKSEFSIFDSNGDDIPFVKFTKVNSRDFIGVGTTTFYKKQGAYNYTYFYKIDVEGNVQMLKKIKVYPSNHVLIPQDIVELDNGDIALVGSHNVYMFDEYGDPIAQNFGKRIAFTTLCFGQDQIGISTTVAENDMSSIHLYPNPVKNTLKIFSNEYISGKIGIYDNLGRLVMTESIKGMDNTIDVRMLSNGMYSLTIESDKGVIKTTKFVKE